MRPAGPGLRSACRRAEEAHGDHPGADQRRADVGRDRAAVGADVDDRDDQRQARRAEEREARGAPPSELAQPEQRREPADDEQQAEEERGQHEAGRREEAVEVEVHPRDDEVDRDQEAEADPLEPHLHDLALGAVEHEPHDQAGGERAEHEVEADVVREPDERGEHEHRQPNGRLGGRMDRVAQDAEDARRPRAHHGRGAAGHDRAEDDEQDGLLPRAVDAGQEDRDDDDRPELAGDARAERRSTERGRQQTGVGEDRHECAERGRAQRDADQPALGVEPAGMERVADRDPAASEIAQPAVPRATEPARHVLLDHLEPGEEEEEHEPEVREEGDVGVDLRETEHLGPDQDPEHDLDHDRRQHDPVMDAREDRRERRRRKHEDERLDVRRRDGCGERSQRHVIADRPGRPRGGESTTAGPAATRQPTRRGRAPALRFYAASATGSKRFGTAVIANGCS